MPALPCPPPRPSASFPILGPPQLLGLGLRCAALACAALTFACDPGAPASFPPEDRALAAQNRGAGDPYAGRFPFAEAVAGLPESGALEAKIITDAGELRCRLLPEVAPLAVANFIGLARGLRPFLDPHTGTWETRPFYDGLAFHRAVERQFVQAGRLADDPFIGFFLQDERSIGTLFDKPGVLALGNDGRANTSSAEFFITTAALRQLDGAYTIIGRCDAPLVVRALEAQTLAGEPGQIETIVISREP